mmetsp:Transcript_28118/g.32785  ORF Transcript_28118/g.32785 Transcript_28118/m.32785 type:complete len:217 (+) Transcript_28118:1214-1864(+)
MRDTIVHDCAATGLYIGDLYSHASIEKCIITRNGNGTRLPTNNTINSREVIGSIPYESLDTGDIMDIDNLDDNSDLDTENDHILQQLDLTNQYHNLVPPGHSGMYVETSTAAISNCLVTRNSLTGLSVVRGGEVKIAKNDIFGNGAEPVTIEDAHDLLLGHNEGIRGGVEDLGGNNYNKTSPTHAFNDQNGPNKGTQLPSMFLKHTTVARLHSVYV